MLNECQLIILDALASGDMSHFDWLVDWFGNELSAGYYQKSYGRDHGIPAYAVALGNISLRRTSPSLPSSPELNLTPYNQLFAAWEDEAKLAGAIAAVCDYHLSHMSDTDDDIREFYSSPHSVLPIAYLALKKLRSRLGLNTPRPSHVLLDTPFAEPPDTLPEVDDDLLTRTLDAVRQMLPAIL